MSTTEEKPVTENPQVGEEQVKKEESVGKESTNETTVAEEEQQLEAEMVTFPIFIKTCGEKKTSIQLQVSPNDNIQDIKQFLFESIDTCYITNYQLTFEGTKINDFAQIKDISGIKANSTLEMTDAYYDERTMRLHVRRLREILISADPTVSVAVFSSFSDDVDDESDKNKGETKLPTDAGNSLGNYFPPSAQSTPPAQCLKSVCFSGWNPPPGNRKLSGDLLYLEVVTMENKTFHLTGWTKGFYVNATTATTFNPNAAEKALQSSTLVGVLSQLSPIFKKNFQIVLTNAFQKHPFEMFPVPYPLHSWVARKEKHNFDLNRAEDALLLTSETDMRGQLRDWNEEYQNCKELPRETIQERSVRDAAIFKVHSDFLEAATKGACAIIEKTVPPINPLDPEKAHMYLYNNIFFSFAMDGRDFYKEFGGDKAAYVSVNNDLKGIRLLNKVDVKGLYTLATAIVDYRGYRVVAQSIIPGILQREQTSNVVYGSIDNGKTICADEEFHKLMLEAGKVLYIKEHTVVDGEGKEFKLCSPIEAKGIVGTDNRKYILDLVRVTPRDANFEGKQNTYTTLRPELVMAYYDSLIRKERLARLEKKQQEKKLQAEAAEKEKKENPKEEIKESAPEQKSEQQKAEAETKTEAEEEEEEEDNIPDFPGMNPNVLCDYKLGATPESIAEDEKRVKELSTFLLDTMIPVLLEDFAYYIALPVDGQTLTTVMHTHGINMRYLGKIAKIVDKSALLRELVIREIVTRSAKHILRAILRELEPFNLAAGVAHFLNCLVGNAQSKETEGKRLNKKKSEALEPIKNVNQLSASKLWAHLTADVKERFQYDLPDRDQVKSMLRCVQTLRSICIKVGIQIETRDYNFNQESPISTSDISNLYPVVKHCEPESSDGQGLLGAGKSFMTQGRLDIAYELLTEALNLFQQVYGPMHRDTANCYSNLAMVLYQAKDYAQAYDHQQRATIINERVLGLDHNDTSHSYGNLGLFCHQMGKPKLALTYLLRSLYLGRLVAGPVHPDTATTLMNVASMFQDIGQQKEAIHYMLESLKCYEELFGTNSLQTASVYHSIALAYSTLGQYKDALAYEKKNYSILHEQVGDADLKTVESNICLKQFTAKAVQVQIETSKTQRTISTQLSQVKLDKIKSVNLSKSASLASTTPVVSSTASTVPMGSRPLSEVMSYINGKSSGVPSIGKSFGERNKKMAPTPLSAKPSVQSDSSNGEKKKKTKQAKGETPSQ